MRKNRLILFLSALVLTFGVLLAVAPLQANAATSGDYEYIVSNGEATITEYLGESSTVVIPSTLGGYPVRCIGVFAFQNRTSLKSVTIPDSVTYIQPAAFAYCYSLTSITIPESVTRIDDGAFAGCSSMTTMLVEENNPVYHSEGNCLIDTEQSMVIAGCRSSLIPDGVKIIGHYAFEDCSRLLSIEIPDSVTDIYPGAFKDCVALRSIVIPAGVTYISGNVFSGCSWLESIVVDAENPKYRSEGNCLIKTESGKLITGCKSSVIPEGVTCIGDSAFESCISLKSIELPNTVESIEHNAFRNCNSLASVTLPDSLTSIGDWAFSYSDSLTSITIPKSVTNIAANIFYECNALEKIVCEANAQPSDWNTDWKRGCSATVYWGAGDSDEPEISEEPEVSDEPEISEEPEVSDEPESSEETDFIYEINNGEVTITGYTGSDIDVVIPSMIEHLIVTKIGDMAFKDCESITSVSIPEGVTVIGTQAFRTCTSLTKVTLPESLQGIYTAAFADCTSLVEIDLPSSLTRIEQSAFIRCSALKKIEIPSGVTNLNHFAFQECTSLETVILPPNLSTIGVATFSECSALTEIDIPDTVTSIGQSAFSDCSSLSELVIPAATTSIGSNAFGNCAAIKTIVVNKSNPVYYSEGNCLIEKETETLIRGCNNSIIPDSIKIIDNGAFDGCASLTDIIIPGSVVSIGENAFYACSKLETLTIENGVIAIGDSAFYACGSLSAVSIPKSVESIGSYVFSHCKSLKNIYCAIAEQPEGWSDTGGGWIGYYTYPTVHWGYKPTDANLIFSGASITLFDDLTVNFKADAALFETYTDPYVVFVQNGIETTVTEYAVEDGYVVFAFADILPNQMNDEITATMYATLDGTVYMSEAKAYSVATYCYNMLDKYSDDEKLRTLLVDILNYGAATQEYTDYNTANLANAGLTDAQKAWASPDRAFVSVENVKHAEIASPAVAWIGAGLNLSESIAVRYEFTTASTDGLTAKVTCGGKTWEIADFSKNENGDDVLLVYINAGYMSEPIYVTLYDGETAVSDTVCYSIESYASTYGEDAELGALVKAMMKYGDAASAYITKG